MSKFHQNQQEKEKTESFLSSLADKTSRVLIFLTLLCLPIQLGKHFWPEFAFIHGLRIDYLSPTLYVTDILIGLVFLTTSITIGRNLSPRPIAQFLRAHTSSSFVTGMWLVSLIYGIMHASHPIAGWYEFLKLLEFSFFGILIAKRIDMRRDRLWIIGIFSFGITLETLLGIAQVYLQRSVGGVFYFLGERTFSAETPGIANASIHGDLVLRPYGTFPHPNVFAAYLLISLLVVSWCTSLLSTTNSQKRDSNESRWLLRNWVGMTSIASIGIVISLSRSVVVLLGVFLLGIVLFFLRRKKHQRVYSSVLIVSLIGVTALLLFSPVGYRLRHVHMTEESIVQRGQLTNYALKEYRTHPVVGVGLQNELYPLPFYERKTRSLLLQPVHSLPLLILAETGLCGLCFFFYFLSQTFRRLFPMRHYTPPLILLTSVLLLGLTDHYFLTLQQGQLLLTTVFGLLWSYTFLAPVMEKN